MATSTPFAVVMVVVVAVVVAVVGEDDYNDSSLAVVAFVAAVVVEIVVVYDCRCNCHLNHGLGAASFGNQAFQSLQLDLHSRGDVGHNQPFDDIQDCEVSLWYFCRIG